MDIALRQFLRLLIWLRLVLMQDAAVLFMQHPSCPIFQFPPFNSSAFRDYAATSTTRIAEVEEQARLAFANLPEHMVISLRGAVANMSLDQKRERDKSKAQWNYMQEQMLHMRGIVEQLASSKSSRRKGNSGT